MNTYEEPIFTGLGDAESLGEPMDPYPSWEGEDRLESELESDPLSFEAEDTLDPEAPDQLYAAEFGGDYRDDEAYPVAEWENDGFEIGEETLALDEESFIEPETGEEQEIVLGTNKLRSVPARQAKPPCSPPSPATADSDPSPERGSAARVPDWRPGSGRVRRLYSKPYVTWLQQALNQVLGTALVVDGLWGRRTAAALRQFQKREGLTVDGKIGPQSEGALRRYVQTDPPAREVSFERLEPATTIAAAGLALNFVKFGFDTIGKITAGDVAFHGPRSAIGIRASNIPNTFLLKDQTRSLLIANFIEKSMVGVEQANIKLRCKVVYNGLELQASLSFDPQGRRSRLGRDTVIRIGDPRGLETRQAPLEWQRCGVATYRVLRIPVSFSINRPWPLDNYNENFELVLSTMYGFGATKSGPQHAHIQDQRVAWN